MALPQDWQVPVGIPQDIQDRVLASYNQYWSPYNQARMADEGSGHNIFSIMGQKPWNYGFSTEGLSPESLAWLGSQASAKEFANVDPFAPDWGRANWSTPRPEGFLDSGMGWMIPVGLAAAVAGAGALGFPGDAAAAAAPQSASLGSGLSLGAGGQTGLTLGGSGLGLTAPAGTWAIPEWSALAAGGLGSGLSLNAGGEGLRYSNIPNLSSMGGGQGLTLPVEGGTLTEAGVIPASGTWGGASQSMSLSDAMRGLDQLSKMGGGTPALSEALSGALGGGETGLKLPALTTAETAPEINPATIPQFSGQSFFSDAPYMMSPYAGMTEGEAGKATEGPANERVVGQGSVGDNPGLKASLGDMFGSPMTAEGLQQRLWRAGGGYPFFGSAPDQGSLQQRIERLRRAYF